MKGARILIVLTVAAGSLTGSLAWSADLPLRPAKPPLPVGKSPAAMSTPNTEGNVFVAPDATCISWTDGCRTCQRDQASGNVSCSNIGIACQPNTVACQKR